MTRKILWLLLTLFLVGCSSQDGPTAPSSFEPVGPGFGANAPPNLDPARRAVPSNTTELAWDVVLEAGGWQGCYDLDEFDRYAVTIARGPSEGHVLFLAFHDPDPGCGETYRGPTGGAFLVTAGNPDDLTAPVSAEFRPGDHDPCGHWQIDVVLDDGETWHVYPYALINGNGDTCSPPEPPVTAPPPPPTCESLGTCPPPPPPPTCVDLGTCEPPGPPTCEDLGTCEPPPCTENCEPPCETDCAPPQPKVALCHIWAGNDGFNEVTLMLPPTAVQSHLRHHQFDYLGACTGHSPNPDHPETY